MKIEVRSPRSHAFSDNPSQIRHGPGKNPLGIHLLLDGLVSIGEAAELAGEPRLVEEVLQYAA